MKRNPILWSTLRQPVRSLLFLLVIAVASFAFVARATEYLVVSQETERLKDYYRPIGYLKPEVADIPTGEVLAETFGDWWLKDVTPGIPIVSNSAFVNWEDQRRYCSGVLQGMQNSDLGFLTGDSLISAYFNEAFDANLKPIGLHVSDVVFYGTLLSKGEPSDTAPWFFPLPDDKEWYMHEFLFQVDQVEAGYQEYVHEGAKVPLLIISQNPEEIKTAYAFAQEGQRYLVKAQAESAMEDDWYIAWYGAEEDGQLMALRLKPIDKRGLYFYPVDPGETMDWTDPTGKELQKEIEVQRENQSAMAVIGVKDMSTLPRVQEVAQDYLLAEGRWLNQEDDLQGRKVCVVHKNFAALRGLSVGDTLTLKLRDLKAPLISSLSRAGFGGVDTQKDRVLVQESYILEGTEDWEAWKTYPTQTETFEIVGLYGSANESAFLHYEYGTTYLYIPNSCMPEEYGQEEQVHMDSYSFRLRSAEDTEAFLQEVEGPLAELGLRVELIDKGWENFAVSAQPIQRSTTLNAVVFTLVLLLVLALFAFLYLRQKRNEFAIQRALGMPRRAAVRQLLVPVELLGTLGVAAGGIPAWQYALGKAGETLATLQDVGEVEVTATLSIWWLLGLCAAAVAALLVLTAVGTQLLARRPVLELLQNETARQPGQHGGTTSKPAGRQGPKGETVSKRQDRPAGETMPSHTTPSQASVPKGAQAAAPLGKGAGLALRVVLRSIRRAPFKSLLSLMLALGFLMALGWMNWTMARNEAELDRLYRTTVVSGDIITGPTYAQIKVKERGGGYIDARAVDTIMESGFVQEAYLEAGNVMSVLPLDVDGKPDYSRRVRELWVRGLERPEAFFAREEAQGIEVEYAPGWDETLFATQEHVVILPEFLVTRLGLTLGQEAYLTERDGRGRGNFVVAGQYSGMISLPGNTQPVILLPLDAMKEMLGINLYYTVTEIKLDPAMNREMATFRKQVGLMNRGYKQFQYPRYCGKWWSRWKRTCRSWGYCTR